MCRCLDMDHRFRDGQSTANPRQPIFSFRLCPIHVFSNDGQRGTRTLDESLVFSKSLAILNALVDKEVDRDISSFPISGPPKDPLIFVAVVRATATDSSCHSKVSM